MQVILKPDPGNPQDLYLGSLKALGIDTDRHDVRFVEDNWENPALGAWGLGWEVWMDGELVTCPKQTSATSKPTALVHVICCVRYEVALLEVLYQGLKSIHSLRQNRYYVTGQEITQFTYFQQAGGQMLEIPSVEITYGLERIITILQVTPPSLTIFITKTCPEQVHI